MPNDLTSAGIVGILVLMILKEVLGFVKARNGKKTSCPMFETEAFVKLNRKIEDLHVWHAPDATGQQNWKNPRLEVILEKLVVNMEQQTNILEKIACQVQKIK